MPETSGTAARRRRKSASLARPQLTHDAKTESCQFLGRVQFLQDPSHGVVDTGNLSSNETELTVDAVKPFVHRAKLSVNGHELSTDSRKPRVDCRELRVDSREPCADRRKPRVYFREPAIHQLSMLSKVFCQRFAAHGCFDGCYAFLE